MNQPSEEIKARLNIADVVGEYIRLQKAGANYKALCPFHNEKTPSLMISPDKGIWHCFGCGEGGDVFGFVMKMEGLEFGEALRLLARKAGVELKRRDVSAQAQTQKGRLFDIMELATKFFHETLLKSKSAEIARAYLKQRAVDDLTRDEFVLGYAVESWDALGKFLRKKGFTDSEIIQSGMGVRKDQGGPADHYDRFRSRLMFPITDQHGRVVGFGGRILQAEEGTAKYINSPQTPIYNKSEILYALDKAKTTIRRLGYAIIVEGYMDALSSHQHGIENVVAASGTALTESQLALLKRYTDKIILAFDMDLAGDSATKRGIDLAIARGFEVKVALLLSGKDPDELLRENPAAWKETIKQAQTIMDYYFTVAFRDADLDKVEDKKKASKFLLPVIKKIPDRIEQAHYLSLLAMKLKVKEEVLQEALRGVREREPGWRREETKLRSAPKRQDEQILLGERIIGAIIKYPAVLGSVAEILEEKYFPPTLQPLYKSLADYYNNKGENYFNFEEYLKQLKKDDENLAQLAARLSLFIDNEFFGEEENVEKEIRRDAVLGSKRLAVIYLRKRLGELEADLGQAEREGKDEQKLAEEFKQVSEKLSNYLK